MVLFVKLEMGTETQQDVDLTEPQKQDCAEGIAEAYSIERVAIDDIRFTRWNGREFEEVKLENPSNEVTNA